MARPLRIEYPGAFYHVLNRGQRQEVIVEDDRDRERFLLCLERMVEQYGVRIHTYCLMTNHYHLILETPEANLSRAVQWLNVSYASYFNRRHQYAGHLFQGRFKAILLEADEYLASLSRYIHLNPLRARITLHPWEYAWSSCQFYAMLPKPPQWLTVEKVLSGFGRSKKTSRKRYTEYLSESDPVNPCKGIVGSSLMGSDGFVEWVKAAFLSSARGMVEISELKQLMPRPSVELIVECVSQCFHAPAETIFQRGAKCNLARDVAIYLSRELSGQTCQALGQIFGRVSGAAITMRHKHIKQALTSSRRLKRDLQKLRKQIADN